MSQNDHAARLREMADGNRRWSVAYEHETDPISQLRLKSLRSEAAALLAGAEALDRVAVLERELAEVPDETQPPTSQWRPIAEAEGSEGSLMVGGYLYGDWTRTWGPYKEAVRYGYTHYMPIPEPPAREGE
jgi:hypothetical protein